MRAHVGISGMSLDDVLPKTWSRFPRGAGVGGVALAEIADTHGTPVYVVDVDHIESRLDEFRAAFGDEVRLAYAAKAFWCVEMAALIDRHGWWADVVSAGELSIGLAGGLPAARMLMHGNFKTDRELDLATERGVGRIIADDPSEITRLDALDGPPVDILLRLNVDVGAETHPMIRTTGADVHFGMSADAADLAIELSERSPAVRLAGVHVHIGSQLIDPSVHGAAVEAASAFLAERRARFPQAVELDVGGGMAVPYVRDDPVVGLDRYADAIASAVASGGIEGLTVTVEPGRSVVANAGMVLYSIGVRKEADLPFLAVDGGLSDNPRPAMYGARYETVLANRPDDPHDRLFQVVGRHCETGDRIATGWLPADAGPGDLVAIPAAGAYAFSMASRYNMTPRRPVVFAQSGRAHVAVAGETLDDVVR